MNVIMLKPGENPLNKILYYSLNRDNIAFFLNSRAIAFLEKNATFFNKMENSERYTWTCDDDYAGASAIVCQLPGSNWYLIDQITYDTLSYFTPFCNTVPPLDVVYIMME